MAKDLEIVTLLDFYGEMLTQKQHDFLEYYYGDDLSLSEIATNEGITRQGVRDSIKRSEQQLYEFEQKLGMLKRFNELEKGLEQIANDAEQICQTTEGEAKKLAERIQNTARSLSADNTKLRGFYGI